MKKNVFVAMSSILVLGAALAGCGGAGNEAAKPADNNASQGATAEKPAAGPKVLRLNLHSEPPTADPGIAEDSTSGTIIRATFEGLTRNAGDGKVHEAAAESYTVSEDGKTYTFKIRDAEIAFHRKKRARRGIP